MTKLSHPSPDWYQRLFAWGLAHASPVNNESLTLHHCCGCSTFPELKRSLFASAQGTVLEIGPGAGANLAVYPANIKWIGIEPNPYAHNYLRQEAERVGLKAIAIHQTIAEHLPAADNSVDTVVSSHVLCSVKDLPQSLREIYRILKPAGAFRFIEHVAAAEHTRQRQWQNFVQPLWQLLFDGCQPNRDTGAALKSVGFQTVDYQDFDVALPVVRSHIAGIAIK